MYELCAFMKATNPVAKKPKPRKPSRKPIRIGANVEVHGRAGVVTRRDTRCSSAWYVAFNEVEAPFSLSRDMIHVL